MENKLVFRVELRSEIVGKYPINVVAQNLTEALGKAYEFAKNNPSTIDWGRKTEEKHIDEVVGVSLADFNVYF